jgi:hypothetical protein
MNWNRGLASLTLLTAIVTIFSSGCSSTSTVHLNSSFDLSVNEHDLSTKKNKFYDEIIASMKKDNGIACAFASDKRVEDQAKGIYSRLVQEYPDPITTITTHKIAAQLADVIRINFAASSNEIFDTPGAMPQLRGSRLASFDFTTVDTSDTRGTISISAKFRAKTKVSGDTSLNPRIQDGDTATVDFKISYSKTSPTSYKFETGELTYKIFSLAAVLDKLDDKAIDRLVKQAYANIAINSDGLDALRNKIKTEITSGIFTRRFTAISSSQIKSKTEKTYEIDFNTAVGRMQRKLNNYKFDPGQSSFSFRAEKDFAYCGGTPAKYGETTTIKLFPESNGRTAAVLETSRDDVFDGLLKVSSGRTEGKTVFDELVANVDRILK